MRDYAKAEPKMWHGETFKALRRRGSEGVTVALYLMTSPSSNMLGLFCQPVLYMAHETGLGIEGATKGLQDCIDCGYCAYDEASEFVWVFEMAKYQISEGLKASDLRCKGIQKDYDSLPDNPFLARFFDAYAGAFHLQKRRGTEGLTEAPCKPLRSQEQEQEQEQEKKDEYGTPAQKSSSEPDPGQQTLPGLPGIPLKPDAAHQPTPLPPFDGRNAEVLNGKAVVPLAEAWALPEAWGMTAEELGFSPAQVLREEVRFRAHWTVGRGKGTRRSVKGWASTWMNWLEKAAKDAR